MHISISSLLLQAAPQQGNPMMSVFLMVGMIAVMYFFMIRPQAKRAKEQKKFAETIGEGEKVITTSGIHGRIVRINDDGTLQLEVARGMFVTVERSAVSMELTAAYRKKTDGATTPAVVK